MKITFTTKQARVQSKLGIHHYYADDENAEIDAEDKTFQAHLDERDSIKPTLETGEVEISYDAPRFEIDDNDILGKHAATLESAIAPFMDYNECLNGMDSPYRKAMDLLVEMNNSLQRDTKTNKIECTLSPQEKAAKIKAFQDLIKQNHPTKLHIARHLAHPPVYLGLLAAGLIAQFAPALPAVIPVLIAVASIGALSFMAIEFYRLLSSKYKNRMTLDKAMKSALTAFQNPESLDFENTTTTIQKRIGKGNEFSIEMAPLKKKAEEVAKPSEQRRPASLFSDKPFFADYSGEERIAPLNNGLSA